MYSLSIGSVINGYPNGGTFRASVKTTSECAWSVTSNADWIHVTNGASGKGDGAFAFVVDSNAGSSHVGTLVAAGEVVVFNQSS